MTACLRTAAPNWLRALGRGITLAAHRQNTGSFPAVARDYVQNSDLSRGKSAGAKRQPTRQLSKNFGAARSGYRVVAQNNSYQAVRPSGQLGILGIP